MLMLTLLIRRTLVLKGYYVYMSYYRGIVVYVGKGKGLRLNHTFKGESSNKILNEFYFRNMYLNDFPLYTKKVCEFSTEREALSYEKDMIRKLQPVANRDTSLWVEKNMSMYLTKKLRKIFDTDKITPEIITTRYDEDLIYTKFGLPCEVKSKSLPEFLEYCENGNVRLTEDTLQHFPTKRSKYLFCIDKIPCDIFLNTSFEDFYSTLEETESFTNLRLQDSAKNKSINTSSLALDYSQNLQIKWNNNVRLILLRKEFPDDFEDAFGYLQLSKDKGFYFTSKEIFGVKSASLVRLNRLDFSDFCKNRVSF